MTAHDGTHVTDLLGEWRRGNPRALSNLMPKVYGELGRLAHDFLRRERTDHTLETAALIHEAFLRLSRQGAVACKDRRYFFGVAARTMRRILVEHARRRRRPRRDGALQRVPLERVEGYIPRPPAEIAALHEALASLRQVAPEQARVVELRIFGGFTAEEIAQALHLSAPTVTRRWRVARAWLYRHLQKS
ncbi:MAG: sigma-70 family RNA polymerase sigma factor [Acidobacteria bacterium]|nr:sigma-70 family RNA polymerase sigma factor [Acidobacteriota bacterium]